MISESGKAKRDLLTLQQPAASLAMLQRARGMRCNPLRTKQPCPLLRESFSKYVG